MLHAFAALAALAPLPQDQTPAIEARVAAALARIDEARLRRTVETLVGFGTRHVASATGDPAHGTGAARAFLASELQAIAAQSDGRLTVAQEEHDVESTRLGQTLHLVNVVATLRGTVDPERIYVVGGHYDSINGNPRDAQAAAPGANDDASGTAVALEACRVLAAGPALPATILFVCYDGEEMGLLGSEQHARSLAERGARVDGMITNDIVGNTLGVDGERRDAWLRCFSYAARGNDSAGRSLARAATFAARRHVPGFEVRPVLRGDRYGRGGDHRPFSQQGFPAIRFTEPREDYSRQHQDVTERDGQPYGDLPAFVDFAYLARVCAVNVALLAELACAPPPPASVQARGARDAYDTVLTFAEAPLAEAYEAVWRLTTSADWEGARLLPAGELRPAREGKAATLRGLCLDDLVVGLRSVGADGSRSRAATPPEPDAFDQRPAARERR